MKYHSVSLQSPDISQKKTLQTISPKGIFFVDCHLVLSGEDKILKICKVIRAL